MTGSFPSRGNQVPFVSGVDRITRFSSGRAAAPLHTTHHTPFHFIVLDLPAEAEVFQAHLRFGPWSSSNLTEAQLISAGA